MEPVYADGGLAFPGRENGPSFMSPGTVQVSPEKRQIIGLRTGQVEKSSETRTLRVTGRVTADETRVYRLNAVVDGWIRNTYRNSTGSLVRKDQPLATFYSPEFLAAQQAYLYALSSLDRWQANGRETLEQIALTKADIQSAVDSLRNLGMGDIQIEEMKRTRQLTQDIVVTAPTTGFVLARNVSPGQRFEKGTELYRIADLSRMWILADLYGNEARYLRPGVSARVTLPDQDMTFQARVSDVLPQFDAATRTLKVRLELDNPGYTLRPKMFVDVELGISLPPTISVPVDSVRDSGLKKTVFVDRGNGFFEPRQVKIGWRFDERVEIVQGLTPGEWIVTSGNFLLDSESRKAATTAGHAHAAAIGTPSGREHGEPRSGPPHPLIHGGPRHD
jgi:membrane fusion protein, copper/silver efflux system